MPAHGPLAQAGHYLTLSPVDHYAAALVMLSIDVIDVSKTSDTIPPRQKEGSGALVEVYEWRDAKCILFNTANTQAQSRNRSHSLF
jgi:hypothetical protein